MKKRKSFPKSESRRDFKSKSGVHPKNYSSGQNVMRGGVRL